MLNRFKAFGLMMALACVSGAPAGAALAQAGAQEETRMYNPATVTTVEGTVTAIDRTVPSRRGGAGVHLTLRTSRETVSVHLGPARFVDAQRLELKVGDVVRVTGSRIRYAGQPAIVAASLTKGDQTMVLRDAAGRPAWAGQRMR